MCEREIEREREKETNIESKFVIVSISECNIVRSNLEKVGFSNFWINTSYSIDFTYR